MGTPVPPEAPIVRNENIYYVILDCFQGGDAPWTCESPYAGTVEACITGVVLNSWRDQGFECSNEPPGYIELILFSVFSAQRIIYMHGPYILEQDCRDDWG